MSERPLSVLILEDHAFQRRIGVRLLKACGATEVLEADNGKRAIEIIGARTRPIDLLVCDLMLPEMDGVEFLRFVAEQGLASSVIVASSLEFSIIKSIERMAQTYGVRVIGAIEKPITDEKLRPLILRHLAQQTAPARPSFALMSPADIREALAARQFEPFFQPKVDLRSRALLGAEAVVRWRHPERGLIPPGAFIAVMEANGLIDDVTGLVFEKSLQQCSDWLRAGLAVPVSVNVSAISLADTQLPDKVAAMASRIGVDPEMVTIEVTESAAMTDMARSLDTLVRLRMKGFRLSIDDYGTGFASMQHLSQIPFTEMKIDQSFVTGAAHQSSLEAMVDTSLSLARRLNLKTIAEGVEMAEDWDMLTRLGCDGAQGYFVARPMPGDVLAAWLRDWLKEPAAAPG